MELIDRYRGALMGLATGDAVGVSLEFRMPGSFKPISDMVGGGTYRLAPGQWTDDTSMALCLAESLVEKNGFDPVDQLERYLRWWKEGHLSSTGECFDIGNTTRMALMQYERERTPYCGSINPRQAGNGSIMRLAPVPLFFARNPREAVERSGESSRTTHGTVACIDCCRYLGALIVGALEERSKEELPSERFCPVPGFWSERPLMGELDAVAAGSFKYAEPPTIQATGHVVKTLEAALWAFHRTDTYKDGCLKAVNLGDDADTVGAVYGQLAGAFYGERGIPESWRSLIHRKEMILGFADRLHELSRSI